MAATVAMGLLASTARGANDDLAALAQPVAGKAVVVECGDAGAAAGLAFPWESPPRVLLQQSTCDAIRWGERGGWWRPIQTLELHVLLHEAGHIGQGPVGPWDEHDAECRALAGLDAGLQQLGYGARFARRSFLFDRWFVSRKPAPYGGPCLLPDPAMVPAARARPNPRSHLLDTGGSSVAWIRWRS